MFIFNKTQEAERCSEEEALESHQRYYRPLQNFNYYLPNLSCFLCSNLTCDFSDPSCDKKSELLFIPLYHDLLEFGFLGNNFPTDAQVSITFSETCFHKIIITRKGNNITFTMQECLTENEECYELYSKREMNIFEFEKYCFFMAIGYSLPDRVNIDYSTTCYHAPSSNFSYSLKAITDIFQKKCRFQKGFHTYVCFTFLQDETRNFDGIPLILPCSTGGYAVDPYTGRFVIGERCSRIFHEITPSDEGLPFLINTFFDGHEHFLFPHFTKESLLPVFVSNNQNSLFDRDQMKKVFEINLKKKRHFVRYQCEYVYQKTKTDPPGVHDETPKSTALLSYDDSTIQHFDTRDELNMDYYISVFNSNDKDTELQNSKFNVGHCAVNGEVGLHNSLWLEPLFVFFVAFIILVIFLEICEQE